MCEQGHMFESRDMHVCVSVHVLPGQIIITDQQQVLHQGQEVALSLGVLHSVDYDVKHFPHITEAELRLNNK